MHGAAVAIPERVITKLRRYKVDEISHVDNGANLFAEVVIAKRGDDQEAVTFDEFREWVTKSALPGDTPASDALAQFVRERTAKADPASGDLHADRPLDNRVSETKDCPHCGKSIPAEASKCLYCKHKVTKALPPRAQKAKRKRKKPKMRGDVAPTETPSDDDPELEDDDEQDLDVDIALGSEASDEDDDFGEDDLEEDPESDDEMDYEGEDDDAPFGPDDEGDVEEDGDEAVAEGEEVEEFDPSKVTLPGDLPREVGEYIGNLEALIESLEQQMREQEQMTLAKAANTDDISQDDLAFLEDISKALDDGEQVDTEGLAEALGRATEVMKAYQERTTAAETVAKAERDIRLTREAVAKVESWEALPFDANELGLTLKIAKDHLPEETYEAIVKALDTANETAQMGAEISESGLFSEVGKNTAGNHEEPADELGREVKKLRETDPSLSIPQAINKVLGERPDLYDQTLKS